MAVFYERRSGTFSAWLSRNMDFPSHVHYDIELVYLLEGQMQVMAGDAQKLLGPGEAAVVFPNLAHGYQSWAENQALVAIFSPGLAHGYTRAFERMRPRCPFVSPEAVHPDVPYVMQRLREAGKASPPLAEGVLRSYLSLLSGRLLERLDLEKEHPLAGDPGLVAQAQAYVHDHADEALSLDRIADALGASKYHLSRCFGQKLGISLHRYVNQVRVQRALGLLQQGAPASEAGYAAGFDSASTFYRVFRAQMGTSPKAYQRAAPRPDGR